MGDGIIIRFLEMECMFGMMGEGIKESGKRIKCMEKGFILG